LEHGIDVRPRRGLPHGVVETYLQAWPRDAGDAMTRPDDDGSAPFALKIVVVVERCDGKVTVTPVREAGIQVSILDLDWDQVENGDVGYLSAVLRKADQLLPPDSPRRRHLLAALHRRLDECSRVSREEPRGWDIQASSLRPAAAAPGTARIAQKREPLE